MIASLVKLCSSSLLTHHHANRKPHPKLSTTVLIAGWLLIGVRGRGTRLIVVFLPPARLWCCCAAYVAKIVKSQNQTSSTTEYCVALKPQKATATNSISKPNHSPSIAVGSKIENLILLAGLVRHCAMILLVGGALLI